MTRIFCAFLLICCCLPAHAARYHVSATAAPGKSGKKWNRAMQLHEALRLATAGDEIWVARGVYRTSEQADRAASFVVPAGVRLYGGFAGNERHLKQRHPDAQSTLTGELGGRHDRSDNAYSVVRLRANGRLSSTLDGFHINGGCGQSYTDGFAARNAGGGLYIEPNATAPSSHLINNCTFEDNYAHNGGAVYVGGGNPVFTNCIFVANTADFHGGAVYNNGRGTNAGPTFEQCSFIDNASNSGAGMTNDGRDGQASPLLVSCKFIDNISLINGAAIFNIQDETGVCEPVLEDCTFLGNESILGDDIAEQGEGAGAEKVGDAPGKRGGTLRPVVSKRR